MSDSENHSRWEALSALVDGEADAGGAAAASLGWRDDAAVRERWHRYQLIGDVLRSEELGGQGHDAAFLQRLRASLAQEPVVLAPATTVARPARAGMVRRWAAPAAVAAGFVMVAGALTVTRLSVPESSAPQLAQAPAVAQPAVASSAVAMVEPQRLESVEVANGTLIRDARLVQYFSAHRQFGGSSALATPSGFLRSATYEGPAPSARSR